MSRSAEQWVHALNLQPHPEGGFYREVYRSAELLPGEHLPTRYGASRSLGTSIYYLLRRADVSRFHRLRSDEIWHYHAGGSAVVHLLLPDGQYEHRKVGADPDAGESPQVIIPRGCWFGATVESGDYILVGCTVFPGFDFADFEIADREGLARLYPAQGEVIKRLCGDHPCP